MVPRCSAPSSSKGEHDKRSKTNGNTETARTTNGGHQDAAAAAAAAANVLVGPDLNGTKGPLDRKLYRQILLPNGLRCLLIEDVVAREYAGVVGMPEEEEEEETKDETNQVPPSEAKKKDITAVDRKQEHRHDYHPHHERHGKHGAAGTADPHHAHHDEDDMEGDNDNDSQAASCRGDDDDDDDNEEASTESSHLSHARNAAACLVVGAGSMYDPPECHGLAHFLEHLLFMGSEKYPLENELDSFIAKRGGCNNAWTEWEYTSYSLDIPQDALWETLDRFAQCFIAPLLSESAVDRELRAIESEFQLKKHSDACRWEQLLCAAAPPDHPMAKFAWGNLRTLRDIPAVMGVNPLQELRTFFQRYYYAANMRLVVVGGFALDELQQQVTQLFADIPALPRESAPPIFLPLPVNPDDIRNPSPSSWNAAYQSPIAKLEGPMTAATSLGKLYRIIPTKETHSLSITWQLPSLVRDWKTKPAEYLAHLVGHEASGSLLSYFRSKAWATSAVAGIGDSGSESSSCHSLFTATFVLSEDGLKEWRQLVSAVYEYIGMLRRHSIEGWPEWIYEELEITHKLSYEYQDEKSPDDLVETLAANMAPHQQLPSERLLDGEELFFDFDAAALKELLDEFLTPENARYDLYSSSFGRPTDFPDLDSATEGTEILLPNIAITEEVDSPFAEDSACDPSLRPPPQVEPMFGTLFWCSSLPREWLQQWKELTDPSASQDVKLSIHLPAQNLFVPTSLGLKDLPDDDAHHPLVNCALKICITVGKTKQWFPATVVQYNRKKNSVLVSYEDENEQWHLLDPALVDIKSEELGPDFEGFFDQKKIKFRVLSTALLNGNRAVIRYGDETDFDVEDGVSFPPIPPALPPSRLPKQISDDNILKMWWLQDRNFHRPIADLRLQILCATANQTPLHRACADLLQSLCLDSLVETSYLASLCDLTGSVSSSDVGFTVYVEGFDCKLLNLFETIFSRLLSFRQHNDKLPDAIHEDRFAACLEVLQRKYKNQGMTSAKLCSSLRIRALRPTIWSASKKLTALDNLDIPSFSKVAFELLEQFAIESLYQGNVDRADANHAKEMILKLVASSDCNGIMTGLPRKRYPSQAVIRIPEVVTPLLITVPSKQISEPNTAVEVYVQVGKDNLRERVLIDLLVHMMEEPFFDLLRTKEQFGYDVYCAERWSYGITGILFSVTTNVKCAQEVVERIDQFLREYRKELETTDEFMEHLVGLAKQKLDIFNSLTEECNFYWEEIRDGRFEWQSWRNEAVYLRNHVCRDDVIKAFDDWLNPDKCKRRIFTVQVIGNGQGEACKGRPEVEASHLQDFFDEQIGQFHKICKKQTWGRVNSKLH